MWNGYVLNNIRVDTGFGFSTGTNLNTLGPHFINRNWLTTVS